MALTEAGLVTALWVIGIYAGVLTVGIGVVAGVVFMVRCYAAEIEPQRFRS